MWHGFGFCESWASFVSCKNEEYLICSVADSEYKVDDDNPIKDMSKHRYIIKIKFYVESVLIILLFSIRNFCNYIENYEELYICIMILSISHSSWKMVAQ